MALLVKGGKLLKVVKIFKALKLMKVMGTFLSMSLSVFAYSFLMGPWFALGFVLLLFVHEMGHVVALRARGYEASAPVFIPFLGAAIFVPGFKSRDDEAFIGIGGPLAGALISALMIVLWQHTNSEMALRLAYVSAYINLFNLLPIRPLDGGRILQVAGSWTKYVGFAALAAFIWVVREPGMILIMILVLDDVNINPRLKAQLAWTMSAAMVALMVTGHSDQRWWMCAIDTFIACMFSFIYTDNITQSRATESVAMPYPPVLTRAAWIVAFIILACCLVAMMAGNTPPTHRPALAFAIDLAILVTAARAAVPFHNVTTTFIIQNSEKLAHLASAAWHTPNATWHRTHTRIRDCRHSRRGTHPHARRHQAHKNAARHRQHVPPLG